MSADVTFFENEPYFLTPYLQGETSLIEDEDRDLFLLELSSSSSIQLKSQSGPSQWSESPNPHVVSIQELESQPPSQNSESSTKVNEILGPTWPLQVYSRKKARIPDLLQA